MQSQLNAKISSTYLGMERGILTFWLHLEWSGAGQGFGGYSLGTPAHPNASCSFVIQQILRILDVMSWEKLPGQLVRVRGTSTKIDAIGHIIEDRWFDIGKELETFHKERK